MELKRAPRSATKSLDITFSTLWIFLVLGCAASFLTSPPRVINQSSQQKQVEMGPEKKNARHKDASNQAASLLVPSQVLHSFPRSIGTTQQPIASVALAKENKSKRERKSRTTLSLVPSQVMQSYSSTPRNSTSVHDANQVSSASSRGRKERRRKSAHRSNDATTSHVGKQNGNRKSHKRIRKRIGDLPDVEWRSIPMEHLRLHPNFKPLPPTNKIEGIDCMEDVRYFRQGTWQWDALHTGRCTTSQVAAALGFLEPFAGKALGVPPSLRRGGRGAYERLRETPFVMTLEEINMKLIDADNVVSWSDPDKSSFTNPWIAATNVNYKPRNERAKRDKARFPFAAKYKPRISDEERRKRRDATRDLVTLEETVEFSVRLRWGNVQEATSLLTTLNYFWEKDNGIMLEEVGMCGAGLHALTNNTHAIPPGLILGASPDALLRHSDGRIEAVEVKNHCPFRVNRRYQGDNGEKRFFLHSLPVESKAGVLPHYVPQLMMEMFSVGPDCVSAIMVRQTATNGSLVLRIKRNNDWIEEMFYWLTRFHNDFVKSSNPPPPNFFFNSENSEDKKRYLEFLEWTKRVESDVDVLDHIPNKKIQRVFGESSQAMDLFLD